MGSSKNVLFRNKKEKKKVRDRLFQTGKESRMGSKSAICKKKAALNKNGENGVSDEGER